MNIQKFREKIGLKKGQLLTTKDGELADILDVTDTHVTLGLLATGKAISVPIENILPH